MKDFPKQSAIESGTPEVGEKDAIGLKGICLLSKKVMMLVVASCFDKAQLRFHEIVCPEELFLGL